MIDLSFSEDRLRTNYIPSENEVKAIKQLLAAPSERLAFLDGEISRVQTLLDKLSHERDTLTESISAHRALLSPARRLPEDVLREIFLHCLPTTHNSVMSEYAAPLILGQICSMWRSITLSTPSLWASLHVSVPALSHEVETATDPHLLNKAVQGWLTRSGICPLSISIACSKFRSADIETVNLLIRTLISYSARWRDIQLFIPARAWSLLSEISKESVPLLEYAALDGYNGPFVGGVPLVSNNDWTSTGLFTAKGLRSVFLARVEADPINLPVSWSQLTNLCLKGDEEWGTVGLSTSAALEVLKKCMNLRKCNLQMIKLEIDIPLNAATEPPLVLPHLETLSVTESTYGDALELFSRLDLPGVRCIRFYTQPTIPTPLTEHPVHASIITLLQRVPHIESFVLDAHAMPAGDIVECLRTIPSIKHLSFTSYDALAYREGYLGSGDYWDYPYFPTSDARTSPVNNSILELLTPSRENNGRCFCPLLEVFECNQGDFSDAALLAFIRVKNEGTYEGVSKLTKVTVSFPRTKELDIENAVLEFSAGMKIKIYYRPAFRDFTNYSPWNGLRYGGETPWPIF
ncbi:hypothetical protein BDQ12DRAFT_684941 [Crucibulum laeve]|uniref:F-box domain-containing protein n=1 Tax=Crucibulum laeve TaxID=68775 RepID=A0A5C3LXN3_9AGAR|nr:hypothetical protein BDQ12DRAFT_684941 [Crucibulum laeve]